MRQREGKPGGGKGPMLSEDKTFTLATGNDQTLFIFHAHRSDGVRLQGKTVNTLTAYMGTGGNNMPMVAFAIQGTMIGRKDHNGPGGPGFSEEGPMYTLTSMDTHAIAFSHTQGLDIQASEEASPTLRREGNGMAALADSVVRKLTPLECERLQGFPDGWTSSQADTNRYKQLGNAVAVPVVEWLIKGICDTVSERW